MKKVHVVQRCCEFKMRKYEGWLKRCIDEFVTQKYKIIFALQKNTVEEKYKQILVEIKKGLFEEVYNELPERIKELIERDCE